MPNRNIVKHHGRLGDHGPNGGQLYAGIPMELARDGKLSYLARSVALYIWSHDEKWQQSAKAVADALGMDRGTVGKALAELQERGWMFREIHQTIGPTGKPRTVWERWHVQMTNRRFTADEIRELKTFSDVRVTPAPSHQTCGPHPHGGAGLTSTGGADITRTIEVDARNAPEVHSSSSAKDGDDETGPGSRSLAVGEGQDKSEPSPDVSSKPASAGSQAVPTHGPKGDAASTASAGAYEAPDEYRPEGLRSPTATGGVDTDPLTGGPDWDQWSRLRQEQRSTPQVATV